MVKQHAWIRNGLCCAVFYFWQNPEDTGFVIEM